MILMIQIIVSQVALVCGWVWVRGLLFRPRGRGGGAWHASTLRSDIWYEIDSHFSRFRQRCSMWNNTAFSEKCNGSSPYDKFEKTVILRGVPGYTPTDLELSYFVYTLYEALTAKKDVFVKHVNLWEFWRNFKWRQIMSDPPCSD